MNLKTINQLLLLPPIAKVFERLLYEMMSYIRKFKLINAKQFGFRQKHKTVDAIASVIEEIRSCLDGKTPSRCVFFDLKKAFETNVIQYYLRIWIIMA